MFFFLFLLLLTLSASLSLLLAIYAIRRRTNPAARWFALVLIGECMWTFGYLCELIAPTITAKIAWDNFQYTGVDLAGTSTLLFALTYTGRGDRVRPFAPLLAVFILIDALVVWSNPAHHLLRTSTSLVNTDTVSILAYGYGPWFWFYNLCNYLCSISAVILLLLYFVHTPRLYQLQVGAVVLGMIVPMVGGILTIVGLVPIPDLHHLDLAPITLAIANPIWAWGLFRQRLLDLVPIARDRLIEYMPDGMLVIDARQRIVDSNSGAGALLHHPASTLIGQTITAVLPDLVPLLVSTQVQTRLSLSAPPRVTARSGLQLEVNSVPLHDRQHTTMGWLVLLRDRTHQWQLEDALRESEARYRALVESSPDAIFQLHPDGRCMFINTAGSGALGHAPDTFIGQHLCDILDQASAERILSMLDRVLHTSQPNHGELPLGRDTHLYSIIAAPVLGNDGAVLSVVGIGRDITERKRMEESLRLSAEHFRRMFDQSPIGAAMVALDSYRFLRVNAALCHITGYTEDELLTLTFLDITHPADLESNLEQARQLAAEAIDQYVTEKRYIYKDGTTLWVYLSVRLVRDANGHPLCFLPIVQDITQRKQAEAALRMLNTELEQRVEQRTADLARSEARSRALLDAMPDSMFLFEPDGTFLDFKTSDPDGLYIPSDQIIGSNLYNIMPQHFYELIRTSIERALATGNMQSFEYQLEMPQGKRDFEARLVVCGPYHQLLAVVRDITERKQAERVLQESEARYRTLVETAPNAILLTDMDSTIRFCNQQAVTLFGYSTADELVEQKATTLFAHDLMLPSQVDTIFASEMIRNLEYTLRRQDGSHFPAELNSTVITDAQGNRTALIIVVRDMTDQKHMEARLIISERFVAGGRLAASVAHEVNTPLQALHNFLSLIQIAPEPDRQNFLEGAQHEVQRVARIVGQLLDIYRPHTTAPGPVDITAIIERLLLLWGKRIKEQKVRVETNLAIPSPQVWGRTDELTQVLLNILTNALDAMRYGDILSIRCWEVPDQIALAISDTGPGINPELLKHIFEPFVTTKESGIGLGLHISDQIVRQHHGRILVDSTPGEGCTFTVLLPRTKPRLDRSATTGNDNGAPADL